MRLNRGLLLTAIAVILPVAGLIHSPALSQAAIPSPEQIELLRSLPPEQQEAILRQLSDGATSNGLSDLGGAGSSSRRNDRAGDLSRSPSRREEEEARDLQRRLSTERREDEEELRNGVPVLRGEDWVIIRIQLPPEPTPEEIAARSAPLQQAAPYALPGGGFAYPSALPPNSLPGVPAAGMPRMSTQRAIELSVEERERREEIIKLVRNRNPYRLSPEGVLLLPGFSPIPLAGLTAFDATVRLQADPELNGFDVSLIRLPLRKIGTEALKPFGYDLFDRAPSTFAPVTNVPVPADYVVGAGDLLHIQLYGNQNRILSLEVRPDGRINFPELGPINVGGQLFNNVRSVVESRVEREMIGVRASVSMGDTRSIRVFVLGEARRPGSYTISGLGTITSALFAAGGVKQIGSLRNIQLKRGSEVVRRFDLYDMLIRGDSTDDAKLLPGDIVFVPPVGSTITVQGEVRRPAIYEVKDETSLSQVVDLAGGLSAQADVTKASLVRIDQNRQRVVLTANLTQPEPVRNGDILSISKLKPTLDSGVVVEGHVFSPATYAYREGLRLTNVIRSVDELKPNADINYVLIRHELLPDREVTVSSADLSAALAQPGTAADVLLQPRDRIIVFDLESGRDRIIRPLLNELRTQARFDRPTEVVSIDGRVRVPGDYPLEPGMTVRDLIRAGGSLQASAYAGSAELTRYRVVNGDIRRTQLINVDLGAVLRGDPAANILLEPFDSLSIKQVPEWGTQEHLTLMGEVRFPGRYSIQRGETLKSVIARAGGLTELAFPEGSVFTRDELREREQKQLDIFAERLQNDLSTLALQGVAANQASAGNAITVGQSLLAQVRASKATGRLVIDLPLIMRGQPGTGGDVIVRDGDRLIVPKFQQEVTVIGEIQTATSHLYRPGLSRDDYISQSGGVTRRADADRISVVRADGSVVQNVGDRWFARSNVEIRPGDTIVVPLDTERMPALPFWQAVTSIIYNLAISAAAVNSF